MKTLISLLALCAATWTLQAQAADGKAASAAGGSRCDAMAAEKKLAGAAKNSFLKKCVKDSAGGAAPAAASPACEKSASDKKLAGAAKTSHIKKCMADAK